MIPSRPFSWMVLSILSKSNIGASRPDADGVNDMIQPESGAHDSVGESQRIGVTGLNCLRDDRASNQQCRACREERPAKNPDRKGSKKSGAEKTYAVKQHPQTGNCGPFEGGLQEGAKTTRQESWEHATESGPHSFGDMKSTIGTALGAVPAEKPEIKRSGHHEHGDPWDKKPPDFALGWDVRISEANACDGDRCGNQSARQSARGGDRSVDGCVFHKRTDDAQVFSGVGLWLHTKTLCGKAILCKAKFWRTLISGFEFGGWPMQRARR